MSDENKIKAMKISIRIINRVDIVEKMKLEWWVCVY